MYVSGSCMQSTYTSAIEQSLLKWNGHDCDGSMLLSCDNVLKFDWYCQLSGSGSNSLNLQKFPGHFTYSLGTRLRFKSLYRKQWKTGLLTKCLNTECTRFWLTPSWPQWYTDTSHNKETVSCAQYNNGCLRLNCEMSSAYWVGLHWLELQ